MGKKKGWPELPKSRMKVCCHRNLRDSMTREHRVIKMLTHKLDKFPERHRSLTHKKIENLNKTIVTREVVES